MLDILCRHSVSAANLLCWIMRQRLICLCWSRPGTWFWSLQSSVQWSPRRGDFGQVFGGPTDTQDVDTDLGYVPVTWVQSAKGPRLGLGLRCAPWSVPVLTWLLSNCKAVAEWKTKVSWHLMNWSIERYRVFASQSIWLSRLCICLCICLKPSSSYYRYYFLRIQTHIWIFHDAMIQRCMLVLFALI